MREREMRENMARRRIWAVWTALALFVSVVTVSPGNPAIAVDTVIDGFEDGDTSDWLFFGGNAAGGGGGPLDDRPYEGTYYFSTGWGGEGTTSSFYGGAFKNFDNAAQVTPPADPVFNVWVLNQSNATVDSYNLEITLREDTNGDGWVDGTEDSIQLVTGFTSTDFDDTWQLISAPLSAFSNLSTGGDGAFNGNLDEVVIVIGGVEGAVGSTVEVDFDSFSFSSAPVEPTQLIDDFESGLPSGLDADGIPIGFNTFSDGSPVSIATTDTPPAPVPGSGAGNNVIALTSNVGSFAGFTHGFENEAVDTWVPQDWTSFEGIRFWLYGQGTGNGLFLDLLDNRNPGSTTDDAERFVVNISDDFTGWQFFEIPFGEFVRKEIGNGAPNDGLTLAQVHGWALGMLGTDGTEYTYYMDQVEVFGVAEIPPLAVRFSSANNDLVEGAPGTVNVKLNRPMNSDDPAQVSVDYFTEDGSATSGRDYVSASGTLTFVNGGVSEQSIPLETLDDTKWEGTETIILRLTNPVDAELGFITQALAFVLENDPYDPNLIDDFERGAFLWDSSDGVDLSNPTIGAADSMALPGQDPLEGVLAANVLTPENVQIEGRICNQGNGSIPVTLRSTDTFDATNVDHTTVRLGEAAERHVDKRTGEPRRHIAGDDLVLHFAFEDTGLPCDPEVVPLTGLTYDGEPIVGSFWRDFPIGQDWSDAEKLSFWYYGQGSGNEVTVNLKDNRAPDPGPDGWSLVWADEFNEPAGTSPDPENWGYEIGDGSVNGIPGWGNDEFQYYTDETDNVATDGEGNLVLTVEEADGSFECYYGPCDYTSARLVSKHRAEFAYGRIEARILVPDGESGLWPAFWSLGTDIDLVGWPQTGEIDFMEYVSRIPNEMFGTIHGPGYSGGESYGSGQVPMDDDVYHTYGVEWQPDLIEFYLDGELYFTATPDDEALQGKEWVFNDPVYLLLNVAIGGNFGGAISPDLELPASMLVDYVRVYQGPDTAERWEASFTDAEPGWQQIELPFSDFSRSDAQVDGAPDDGLGLGDVWGYGFTLPGGGEVMVDQVRLVPFPPPTEITVTNLSDGGEGSLRQALEDIASGGTISFDPGLAGGTIPLTGPLVPPRPVVIDGSTAPGVTLDGGAIDRVLIVDAGNTVTVTDLTLTNGYGFQLAGCVLNNGTLTLERATVTGCTMTTDAGDFWQGGGGIYSGDGATLNLIDSTVKDNFSGWTGGGVYSFFNTTTNVVRSTISGNTATDVGGGMRTLGTVNVDNSTLSGNTSTPWHGGAMFITDGVATITNSTVTGNTAPGGTAGGLFVGTFTEASATLNLQNTIVANNGDLGCFLAPFGAGAVALNSLGNNVFTDGTCNPVGSDQIVGDAGLDVLADYGGPTQTHALFAGSPAIDAASNDACPATDQRGIARDDGACDVGAYEYDSGS